MKKLFLFSVMSIFLLSCSGNDDSDSNNGGNDSQITGTWVLYKAFYEGDLQPTDYEYNGSCGREVLEFHADKTVSETIYLNSNCQNGAGTDWDWWATGNGSFRIGYEGSDSGRTITVSGNEAVMNEMDEWGYVKYYKKAN